MEAIVNSRPLRKIFDDPNDLQALTPNHLLLLRAGPSFPPRMFSREDQYSNKRWKQVESLSDVFWKRWTREYLPLLHETYQPIVFIREDQYSNKRWKQVQSLSDVFWKRWTREYLPLLQETDQPIVFIRVCEMNN